MQIPIHAQVECSDGVCGRTERIIINPVTEKITDFTVKVDTGLPSKEMIVPIDQVQSTTKDKIVLKCRKDDMEKMNPFITTQFIDTPMANQEPGSTLSIGGGPYVMLPYSSFERPRQIPVEEMNVPTGELALYRGTSVNATDGPVGRIDEFIFDAQNDRITHLVLRKGHLWGQKDVVIPISEIAKIEEDTVTLKLSKEKIGSLPTYPVKRHWA